MQISCTDPAKLQCHFETKHSGAENKAFHFTPWTMNSLMFLKKQKQNKHVQWSMVMKNTLHVKENIVLRSPLGNLKLLQIRLFSSQATRTLKKQTAVKMQQESLPNHPAQRQICKWTNHTRNASSPRQVYSQSKYLIGLRYSWRLKLCTSLQPQEPVNKWCLF